jgi:Uma2 family endonuclease
MVMVQPIYYTAEMVRALPDDGNRYEAVHGELLVSPAPRAWHQVIVLRLGILINTYLAHEPVGHLFCSPADISWGPDTLVQPDVFVVPMEQARTLDWAQMTNLLLVAEVLSPSTQRADRFVKRAEYQRREVGTYWVLDPDEQVVECWTPTDVEPTIERQRVVWHPAGASQPLVMDLTALFQPI